MNSNGFTTEEITKAAKSKDLSQIIEIVLSDMNKQSIEGIEILVKTREIDLSCNEIKEIILISKLKEIRSLNCAYNKICDIPKLNLPFLQILNFSFNLIKDCTNISNLISLKELYLKKNYIESPSVLFNLTNLTLLDISYNPIKSISGIGMLAKLEDLYFGSIDLEEDIETEEFIGCKGILELNASSNQLDDPSFLNSFSSIECLDYSYNGQLNISKFPKLITLEFLTLRSVGIVSLSEIEENFPNLVYLDLSFNKIEDIQEIAFIAGLSNIAEVNLEGNPICEHPQFMDYFLDQVKTIEILNGNLIKEPVFEKKIKTLQLKDEMQNNIENAVPMQNEINEMNEAEIIGGPTEKWLEQLKEFPPQLNKVEDVKEVMDSWKRMENNMNEIRDKFHHMTNILRINNEKEFVEAESKIAKQTVEVQKLLRVDKFSESKGFLKSQNGFNRTKLDKIKGCKKSPSLTRVDLIKSAAGNQDISKENNALRPPKCLKPLPVVKTRGIIKNKILDAKNHTMMAFNPKLKTKL